ncbi:MAG: M3 family metallopeptidase, partial [Opitutales bacterium]
IERSDSLYLPMFSNPFLDKSFFIPWSQLTPERVQPDIEAGLKEAREKIDAIAELKPEEVTFESTFLALDEATESLSEAWGKVSHLTSVCDSKELREAYNRMLPEVSEFFAGIPLNEKLWSTLRAYAAKEEGGEARGVRRRFLDETMASFRESGADLPPEKKGRFEKIESELAALTQKFSENVLDATNDWELVVEDESSLKGLPSNAKEAARRNALEKGYGDEENPRWRFTLHMPSMEPFMTYLDDDRLRRRMWEASAAVGAKEPYENSALIRKILDLRHEKAQLLERAGFADLVLERRMAKSPQKALAFEEDLFQRSRDAFKGENAELEQFKAEVAGGAPEPLEPWEILYYSEKQRRAKYSFDEEVLRPYFPIHRVIDGLFEIVQRVFDLRITERKDAAYREPGKSGEGENAGPDLWHPEVKFYEVRNRTGEMLGCFYADWHPRESKRGGAWMNPLITGWRKGDRREPHLGLICGNLTHSIGDKPALLTHREVETIFHEFGHLLHHLCGDVEIKSLNGTNVYWDFVELPSQIMENWCWDRESLNLFARHYETGEVIPDDLFQKMTAARNYRAANTMMRQLAFGRLDLELHARYPNYAERDLEGEMKKVLQPYIPPTRTPMPTILRRFSHLFSSPTGYAAGYYSYKWAEVLDADAFTRFQKEGVLNSETGRAFVEDILSKGNSEDPMKLYTNFMGREPDLQALLQRCGLS